MCNILKFTQNSLVLILYLLTHSQQCFVTGVRQGCILSPYLLNLVVELLMRTALDGYEGGFRIGGRCIANLQYADDIVLIASSEEELQERVNRLHEAATPMGMKISAKLENVQSAIRWRSCHFLASLFERNIGIHVSPLLILWQRETFGRG